MMNVLLYRIGDVALLVVIAWMINFGSCSFVYYLEGQMSISCVCDSNNQLEFSGSHILDL